MEAAPDLDAALAVLRAAGSRLRTASDDELLAVGAAIEQLGRLVDAHRLAFAAEAERRTVSPGAALPLAFRHGSRDAVDLVAHVARIDRLAAKRRVGLGSALAPEVSLLGGPVREIDRIAQGAWDSGVMRRQDVAAMYRGFAEETADESPCFTAWASEVAQDAEVLRWICTLPEAKQQPNLVFAAARWNGALAPGPYDGLRDALLARGDAVRETILTRSTQTNEPRRLTALTPVFAQIAREAGGPLALVEVGASAGLCLYPDRYRYDWGAAGSRPGGTGPVLSCDGFGPVPVPDGDLEVAWRGGSDLHPLDVTDQDAMGWLQTLVWPEQEQRRELLSAAGEIAAASPPEITRGDLLDTLDDVVAAAATQGTVVVFHSAVVAYLDGPSRRAFAARMRALVSRGAVRWVSNEGDRVLPEITRTASGPGRRTERFVLGLDGRAVARTHGHGASLTWLG